MQNEKKRDWGMFAASVALALAGLGAAALDRVIFRSSA